LDADSLDVKSGPFGLKLTGPNAILIALFILQLALIGLSLYEHNLRSREHDEILCINKLSLFIRTMTPGSKMEWDKMPIDLYGCMPEFLYKK
jgi:hypothetical protein